MASRKIFKGKIKKGSRRLKGKITMRCDEIQKKLTAYVDDELDPTSRADVKLHLEQCPQCRAQLEETTKMLSLYKSIPEVKPQPKDIERIMEAITFARSHQKKTGLVSKLGNWFTLQNKVLRWAPAAAALIIFVLIGTFVFRPFVVKKKTLLEKSTTVYTYYEYVAKEKPSEAEPKFGKCSFISIY
jgi:predicted anti-sigma-YlaC factor YlaD